MRSSTALRLGICASIFAIILLLLLKNKLEDLWDQYNIPSYLQDSISKSFSHGSLHSLPPPLGPPGDKVIVMAKLEKDNTDWVTNDLADWQTALYTVDPSPNYIRLPHAPPLLSTPRNKGHEAMAYLTYIIDNYARLPATIAFLHPHRSGLLSAWHTDTPTHDNVAALRTLRLDFVLKNGYVNLRCNWNPGCVEAHRQNAHVTSEVWEEVFWGTSTAVNRTLGPGWVEEEGGGGAPALVGAACCAQFVVSAERVRRRPRSDYVRFREWVLHTEKPDRESGRVMEFLWHVIFGMEAVYCPAEEVCYCEVYGRC